MWPRAATYWERWPCCTGSPCHARCSSRRPRPLRSTWCSNACSRCRYPMARDGRATTALATAFGSAAFGALVGVVLITFLAAWVAQVALAFGPPEYFAVYFLAFASFVGMGGAPPPKTVVSLAAGFAIAA